MTHTHETSSQPTPARDWLLVVDDEEEICRLVTEALRTDLLEVVSASDAHMALHIIAQRSPPPLLVVTDVLMPGMDGLTLARKLSARLPASRIVVISGHLSADSWWPADLREITFLAKPFRMAELQARVDAARTEVRGQG